MTALIIIASIILFFAILLYPSLTIYVKITDEVIIKIGAYGLRFTILPQSDKPKKQKQSKKPKQKKAVADKKQKPKVSANSFKETVDLVLTALKAALKPTAKLLSKLRMQAVDINIAVCDQDADKTAIKYGQVNIAIFNTLSNLKRFMKVRIKCVDIRPDFVGDQDRYYIYFKLKLRLYQIIGAGFRIFFKLIVNIIKRQLKPSQKGKQNNSAVSSENGGME